MLKKRMRMMREMGRELMDRELMDAWKLSRLENGLRWRKKERARNPCKEGETLATYCLIHLFPTRLSVQFRSHPKSGLRR